MLCSCRKKKCQFLENAFQFSKDTEAKCIEVLQVNQNKAILQKHNFKMYIHKHKALGKREEEEKTETHILVQSPTFIPMLHEHCSMQLTTGCYRKITLSLAPHIERTII